MYDYILVGAGLFSAVLANELTKANKTCLVIERRNHIGGNCYTEEVDGIQVHKYGAHIFRTDNKKIWDYISEFAEFNNFVNSPIANYHGEIYNLPFNMNTFSKMWNISTPDQAKKIIQEQKKEFSGGVLTNLEEKAISLVGRDIYEKLIKGYSEKQWGKSCKELPESIIKRIPVRFIYDNNYFDDRYQGIPIGGYTKIIEKMLKKSDVVTGIDFIKNKEEYLSKGKKIIYTGAIDEYYDFCYGELEYRSLRFEEEKLNVENYQGVAVVNYTDVETPYTRIIEHKHFEFGKQNKTIISKEYPLEWHKGIEPFYPINDEKNNSLYSKYIELAKRENNVLFGGRLGEYKYHDMDDTVISALKMSENLLSEE